MLRAKGPFCRVKRQMISQGSCLYFVQFFSLIYESFSLWSVGFEISNRPLHLKNRELILCHAPACQILLLMSSVNRSFVSGSLSWFQSLDRLSVFSSLTAKLAFSVCMASPGSTVRSCSSTTLASHRSCRYCCSLQVSIPST